MHDVKVEVNPRGFCSGRHSHCVQDACLVMNKLAKIKTATNRFQKRVHDSQRVRLARTGTSPRELKLDGLIGATRRFIIAGRAVKANGIKVLPEVHTIALRLVPIVRQPYYAIERPSS
ncbi:hypothetical protein XPA_007167 [Xanthoria parietina]